MEADKAKEEAKLESQQTTIITSEDIAKKQAKSVEDIIFSETGVSRTVDAMGRITVSIRGAEPRHTLILIDGQPVMGDFAKYSGAGDELQRLGTENVDHIEIIQGAASAKYGSDAIGGVINVITKKAAKTTGLQVNVEGRRAKHDGDIFPYQNFFLRADSGQIGKFRAAVYGSKREIMPIYSVERFGGVLNAGTDDATNENGTVRNSLRYYGDIKNIGMSATYDIDDRNKIDFNMDKTKENMERYVKHSDSDMEPQQHFKRDVDRNTYRLSYTGNNGGSTDWKVDVDYAKMREDDIALTSNYGASKYEGKNTLNYIDDIMHKQWNMKASANTQLNDKHLLTYGFGYTKETGEGSRLKNAPNTTTRYIDPWDYDKNLYTNQGKGAPSSNIHDHYMTINAAGIPYYDQEYEYYGKGDNGKVEVPAFTYAEYQKYGMQANSAPAEVIRRWVAFGAKLRAENPDYPLHTTGFLIEGYYNSPKGDGPTYNGKRFKEEWNVRQNRQTIGQATIKKQNFFVQDTWQINKDTILSPIVRLDHSDLFGSNATFNMGLTHNLGGHVNRRLKVNMGTGYTEPGMGELYYNWEMYAGMPSGFETGKLGYYWVGNPNLKPEKSVNVDIGIEGENGNTSTRFNVFHNRIKDYMTTYFTGYLMDFNPDVEQSWKWLVPPDMIYSFKNIGKAEITGVEAEVTHQFDDHWSGKLGYTYLHAINKSDPNMPRQLLDKPQHKVDIGVTYEDKKNGWRASLWGDYYIHMLDSNTIANNGNYITATGGPFFAEGGKQTYEKKTFGIWNLLVQKYVDKDSMVYAGIDNLFNHRDDDQAFQERVYKFGVNLKFGADGHDDPASKTVAKAKEDVRAKLRDDDWFIKAPFDTEKQEGVEFIGDYRARWNSFTGKSKPESRVTSIANIGSAEKNMFEKAEHGFEQRLRAGIDARIGDNTNVTLLGSASGMTGVDTLHDVSDSKGLNHQRMDTVDVTQHAQKWDFSLGRLTEPMGVTGYWFGKEYDGGRAVWTSGKNQVRIGYGDFSQSTGIADSAYTHATRQKFLRNPTKDEWFGYYQNSQDANAAVGYDGLYQKLLKAKTFEERKVIFDQYLEVIKKYDSKWYNDYMNQKIPAISLMPVAQYLVTVKDKNSGETEKYAVIASDVRYNVYSRLDNLKMGDLLDKNKLQAAGNSAWDNWWNKTGGARKTIEATTSQYTISGSFIGYAQYTGSQKLEELDSSIFGIPLREVKQDDFKPLNEQEVKNFAVSSLWEGNNTGLYYTGNGSEFFPGQSVGSAVEGLVWWLNSEWKPEDDSSLPLTFLNDFTIPVLGTVLVQDQIPPIDKAVFAQAKHQFGDDFGVQAWYLRSVGDDTHSIAYANGDHNDVASFDRLANVIGLGATWRIGNNVRLSYDWGQNRTDFGRFMNGNTIYNHETGTSDFDIAGRSNGGTPRFWVARVDIGEADTDQPGSWNAFADYKYFQHGSFFGGNGTEGVPDRYMDGIKSFTIGGGYVPAKDFLLEAFYTFGAKGIGKRDTLYGPEHFTLGDYTRIQATFKF